MRHRGRDIGFERREEEEFQGRGLGFEGWEAAGHRRKKVFGGEVGEAEVGEEEGDRKKAEAVWRQARRSDQRPARASPPPPPWLVAERCCLVRQGLTAGRRGQVAEDGPSSPSRANVTARIGICPTIFAS